MQCRLIMERNFGGSQFIIPSVPGRGQPDIDIMFFPASYGDEIKLDPPIEADINFIEPEPTDIFKRQYTPQRQYLNKSTIIMCNPNALIYQWMITSANAYWLDFFLRRDCNVLIWNYRGYGESNQGMFSPNLTPYQQRIDAERVMQFLVNRIRVKGQIGAYGRSIGGIAAAHLAYKFPKQIKVFIGDRTMGNFQSIVEEKYQKNWGLLKMYKFLSCFWHIDNS